MLWTNYGILANCSQHTRCALACATLVVLGKAEVCAQLSNCLGKHRIPEDELNLTHHIFYKYFPANIAGHPWGQTNKIVRNHMPSFHHGPASGNGLFCNIPRQKHTMFVKKPPECAARFVQILHDLHHV